MLSVSESIHCHPVGCVDGGGGGWKKLVGSGGVQHVAGMCEGGRRGRGMGFLVKAGGVQVLHGDV